jgi:hypothetical protein
MKRTSWLSVLHELCIASLTSNTIATQGWSTVQHTLVSKVTGNGKSCLLDTPLRMVSTQMITLLFSGGSWQRKDANTAKKPKGKHGVEDGIHGAYIFTAWTPSPTNIMLLILHLGYASLCGNKNMQCTRRVSACWACELKVISSNPTWNSLVLFTAIVNMLLKDIIIIIFSMTK